MVSYILRILVHLFLYQSLSKLIDIRELQSDGTPKKPKFLCLHGGGSNATSFKDNFSNWPDFVLEKMDLVFINAPCSVDGATSADERYDWFSTAKDNVTCEFNKSVAYIEDHMVKLGPFDGLLGFSQGAVVGGALPGMQEHGTCLTKVKKLKHVILISGGKLGGTLFSAPNINITAFSSPINIPSLHIFGENDIARLTAVELMEAYVDPLVFYHHGGHEVPKLDEEGLTIMFEFLNEINAIV